QFSQISGPVSTVAAAEVFQQVGFVFAPFDTDREDTYCIQGVASDCDLHSLVEPDWKKSPRKGVQIDQDTYRKMFDQALDAIQTGDPERIVLSVRDYDHHPIPSVSRFLLELRRAYPAAFVYAFYIPGKELWIGASPELLLETTELVQR